MCTYFSVFCSDNVDSSGEQKSPVKEEKKRKASVFSKFGSYRQKKVSMIIFIERCWVVILHS